MRKTDVSLENELPTSGFVNNLTMKARTAAWVLLSGMRRLSIIDLSGGHQPISNEDETVWVICNGEIYNY
jgi:asparagine synthetase B (glutamine-hydrolysing)